MFNRLRSGFPSARARYKEQNTILRKLVCTKSKLSRCLANIILHRQLFETCVETQNENV
jgi:hypothetical protein